MHDTEHRKALEAEEIHGAIVSVGRILNKLKFADDIGLIAESIADFQSLIVTAQKWKATGLV